MQRRPYQPKYRVRADYEHFLGSYFADGVRPVSMQIVVASYEGGGFSETRENERLSAREHAAIVKKYMRRGQIFRYRLLMALSLAPVRTWISKNARLAGIYQKTKECLYRKRRRG